MCIRDRQSTWGLSSCVESIMRGSHFLHQAFVAHSGLLFILYYQITQNALKKTNNIQMAYDLLGEIIKYNPYNIHILASICSEATSRKEFFNKIRTNLVDSNVFLRGLLLSYESFKRKRGIETSEFFLSEEIAENREELLPTLMLCVEESNLNQDNICCVNTALIILMFEDYYGRFESTLSAIVGRNGEVLTHFNKTLKRWNKFYLNKTKDCYGLQFSTAINFSFYLRMKRKLKEYALTVR
eukprot:TRINITY_DN14254_c0_g1_i1.p1 TRINITY_DN14254_c0_g1~~TRINITY_DN14254_c0_g1_i1.p1  ORF type:complete len:261 (+),score=46.92 TRINITY_DN14254_c0_g1_i1:61-783(+)